MYHQQLAMIAHKRTCDSTKTCLESRVKLECEKEQQEQLLLSVIPAYIAAEVGILTITSGLLNISRVLGYTFVNANFLEKIFVAENQV